MLLRRLQPLLALLLWALLTLAGPPALAMPGALVVQAGVRTLPIDRQVEILIEEPGEALTRERVMSPQFAERWRAYPGRKINLPAERRPVWVRFGLRNEGDNRDWRFSVDWALLDEVCFQQFDPQTGRFSAELLGGLAHPDVPRVRKDAYPVFPVVLDPGTSSVLVLRLHSVNSITAPLVLRETRAWQAQSYDYGVAMGLLFGILGVMFCYNLSLYIFTRDPSFRTYSGYLLAVIAYELCMTGFGPLYLWPGNSWLNQRGYEFFAANSFLAATIFFRRFLRLDQAARHLNRMNQAFIVFWAVLVVRTIFPSSDVVLLALTLGGFIIGFVGVYTAMYQVVKGDLLARYFVIAWISIIVATALHILGLAGVIDGGTWLKHAQPIGFVVETVLLSVALAERINRDRASKEAAERESHELSRKVEAEREEKIRAQEHALTVQLKANEELELRVLDRTAELKRAMENLELANRELAKLSVTDALTKVHNRRYFDDAIRKEYDRSARSGVPLALLMCDIDHFKKINDSVGHLAGDECLKLVAAALDGCVGRSTDLVARYGGEEFAIVLPATDAAQAMDVAERARRAVEDIEFIYRGKRVPMSVSLGVVAEVADPARPVTEFIQQADKALYAAKGAGRNRAMLAEAA